MRQSIYLETIGLKNFIDVEEKLHEIDRIDIFVNLFSIENWFPYFKFMMLAYSVDSPYSQLDDDWEFTKRKIAAEIGITDDGILPLVLAMEEPNFTDALLKYLEYQCEREYKHLIMLKETYNQMIEYNLYAGNDMEQKAKNVKHCDMIYEKIKDYEQHIRQKLGQHLTKDQKAGLKKLDQKKHTTTMLSLESLITKD